MKCYCVIAQRDYEISSVVRVYESKEDACAFVKKCEQYLKKKPKIPELPVLIDNNGVYEKWNKADDEYRKNHPAGSDESADEFYIKELEFYPANK